MKIFISLLLILLTSNSFAAKCVQDEVEIDQKTYKVCRVNKYDILSESCKNVLSCFPVKGVDIVLQPTQNPAFTLCEKIKGSGASGKIKSSGAIDSFCLLKGNIVDMNQLLNAR